MQTPLSPGQATRGAVTRLRAPGCDHFLPLTCRPVSSCPPRAQLSRFLSSSGQARAFLPLAAWLPSWPLRASLMVPGTPAPPAPRWAFLQRPLGGCWSLGKPGYPRPRVARAWLPTLHGVTVGCAWLQTGSVGSRPWVTCPAAHHSVARSLSLPTPHGASTATRHLPHCPPGLRSACAGRHPWGPWPHPQVLIMMGCGVSTCWVTLPPAGGDMTGW